MALELIFFVFLAGAGNRGIAMRAAGAAHGALHDGGRGAATSRSVLGLAVSFTFATLVAGAAVQALALPAAWLRVAAIIALGVFGLSMLVPAWGRAMERLFTPVSRLAGSSATRNGFGGGLLMGGGLGLLWTPCVGPIMGTVIALAVSTAYPTPRSE